MVYDIESSKRYYDSLAGTYDLSYLTGIAGNYHKRLETDLIRSMIRPKGKAILDIGTGTGRFAIEFANEASQVYGIDVSDKMILLARAKASHLPNVKFFVMDVSRLEFQERYFDDALCIGPFEFASDLSIYLSEINRVLKPRGQLIFTCFNKNSLFGILPRRPLTESHRLESIKEALKKNGFRLLCAQSSFFIPFQLTWKAHSFLTLYYLRRIWMTLIIFIEVCCLKVPFLRHKGMQFLILCEKT